jgi:hypothetical protein
MRIKRKQLRELQAAIEAALWARGADGSYAVPVGEVTDQLIAATQLTDRLLGV